MLIGGFHCNPSDGNPAESFQDFSQYSSRSQQCLFSMLFKSVPKIPTMTDNIIFMFHIFSFFSALARSGYLFIQFLLFFSSTHYQSDRIMAKVKK